MEGSFEIIIRTFTSFIFLWFFVQLLGKQTIAQRTYHLYIASITMGTIAGNLAFNIKIKFVYFIIALIVMSSIVFILNQISIRNRSFRKWIAGRPVTVIEQGKILEDKMERIGYSLDSLKQALRVKDIFNIEEVDTAILEVNGSLSVLKKTQYQNITKQDCNIQPQSSIVPIELIYNGELITKNLLNITYNKLWLLNELEKRNLSVSDISYAVVGTNGNLYIDLFKDQ